jgi:hypothetical protein
MREAAMAAFSRAGDGNSRLAGRAFRPKKGKTLSEALDELAGVGGF